jgi:calmodulin
LTACRLLSLTNHVDRSGDITAEELGEVMKGLGLNPSESELHDLIAEADVNNNGSIDFNGTLVCI